MGRRPRLGALHLRNRTAPQGPRGDDLGVLRDAGHDPLHVVLERERRALPRRARRGRRPLFRRAQPRVDHRRHPPVQGEALQGAAFRLGRVRKNALGRRDLPVQDDGHRRRVLDGRRARRPSEAAFRSPKSTARSSSSTTRTRRASSERPGAEPRKRKESTARSPSRPARSARRWARRRADSSRGPRLWSKCSASGRGRRSFPIRFHRPSREGPSRPFAC